MFIRVCEPVYKAYELIYKSYMYLFISVYELIYIGFNRFVSVHKLIYEFYKCLSCAQIGLH